MTKQPYLSRVQWGALVARAWADAGFREQLEKDPTATIRAHAEQLGIGLERVFQLPPAPVDLSAEALSSSETTLPSPATATGCGTPQSMATATGCGTAQSMATATGCGTAQSMATATGCGTAPTLATATGCGTAGGSKRA